MTDPLQMLIDAGAIPSTPFAPTSRYSGVPLAIVERRADGTRIVYVQRRFIAAPAAFAVAAQHVVAAGERPDQLAATYLADPLLYWRIADANAVIDPHQLTDTLGRRIDIPLPPGMPGG